MKLTVSKATETRPIACLAYSLWLGAALVAGTGCYSGGGIDPELQAHRRELSKQTVTTEQLPSREADEEMMARSMAGAGGGFDQTDTDMEEETPTEEDEAPAPADDDEPQPEPAPTPSEETFSDDSVRCGDGVVDRGELCDIAIEEGVPGACPMDCDNSDPCKPMQYLVRGCRTRCEPLEPAEGACDAE